jgi:hypothetical protein
MPGARLAPLATLTKANRRSRVLRCALSGAPGPATLIVKVFARSDGGTGAGRRVRFENERASLQFLGLLGDPPLAPRLYAAHRRRLVLVMEDLGTPDTLVQPLLEGSRQDAERGLLAWARCLGEQHARTAGRVRAYRAVRGAISRNVRAAKLDFSVLGLDVSARAKREIEDAQHALARPGPFAALTHHDPCPDNCFREGDRYRFIDFEFGGYRHALLDGVFWHAQFPTCWCANRIPDTFIPKLERAYRAELARGCPAANDDHTFNRAVVAAAFARTFDVLTYASWWLKRDERWGIATVRQRLPTRFRAFATLARSRRVYAALAGLADQAADALDARFAPEPLPVYPAFRRSRSATV